MLTDVAGDLTISSAGTRASAGMSIDGPTSRIIDELGGDPSGHCSRQVSRDDVQGSDLVLVATRDQRSAVARLCPEALDRIYTIRQFGHLLGVALPAARATQEGAEDLASRLKLMAALVRQVIHQSSAVPETDVVDPYRQHEAVYARAALQILPTLNEVSQFLGGAVIPATPGLARTARRSGWPRLRRR